jgi:hypothetical protein
MSAVPAWKLRQQLQQQQQQQQVDALSGAHHMAGPAASTTSSHSTHSGNSGGDSAPRRPSILTAAQAQAKLKQKMEQATLDPNLPPAFKVAMQGRVAFSKQQARRKNNDTWVSLNSCHVGSTNHNIAQSDNDDDDSSFASMADEEEEIIEEEDDFDEEED